MILAIARREWLACFQTPLAWLLLAASQVVLAWILLNVLDDFAGLASSDRGGGINLALVQNLFGSAAVLMLLAAPPLAARALSSERREGTDQLVGAAPVELAAVVLGKFLGLALPLLLLSLLPLGLGLTLLGVAPIDPGLFLAATLGLWLAGLMFCAAGLFAASLTAQPALAVVIAYGILVTLSVLNRVERIAAETVSLFEWLAWNQHLFWFLTGVVRLSDLLYFAGMSALFLALTQRRLANQRLG